MKVRVIDPINPLQSVYGEGEIREIGDPIVRIPPGEDSQGDVVSLPLEDYLDLIWEIDDPIVRIPPGEDTQGEASLRLEDYPDLIREIDDPTCGIEPVGTPGEVVSIPREEFPEMVEHPVIAPTPVASLTRIGGKKADVLKAGAGGDILNGGLGHDTLTGGEGQDTFVFSKKLGRSNVDRILDFVSGEDTIRLSKSIFTKLEKGGLNSDAFCLGAQAQDASDRIVYNQETGELFYDRDGSGHKYGAVKFASLSAHTVLSANDFLIM